MTERTAFYRKLTYGAAMALLLFPLSLLSQPETATPDGRRVAGGKLATLRSEYLLGQADLGEIDPASETIKLATLGLKGVAVNLLWNRADEFKKKEDWSNLTVSLEQLAKLQPNFVTFWKHQAWNLSYNVSVEFDDYRDRYYYVRRGIEFLEEGERSNRDNPAMLSELGWFTGHKIGRSDEKEQYRRLFQADDDFHQEDRPLSRRDNWLISKEWYLKSVDAADNKGRGIGRKSPVVFYSSPAKSQMNYSDAVGLEGLFDRSRRGWKTADQEWFEFGARPISHSTGVTLHLNDVPLLTERCEELITAIAELDQEIADQIDQKTQESLTDSQRAALALAPELRSPEQQEQVDQARAILITSSLAIAEKIATERPKLRREALRLATDLATVDKKRRYTTNYKQTGNFDYWKTRCEYEQTDDAFAAHKLIYRGAKADEQGDPFLAKELYEEGLAKWRKVLDEFPSLEDESGTTGDDILEHIKQYAKILETLDQDFPDDFPLWGVIEKFDLDREFQEELGAWHARKAAASE